MPPYINPVNDFYFRQSQQQYQQQQFNFPPPQQPQIRTGWVSGIEEARASQIDFTSTNLFLDTSNGKIYLKRIGDNGKPQFLTYMLENNVSEKDPLTEINYRLTNIENALGGLKNESVSGNAGYEQSAAAPQSAVAVENEQNGTTESAGFSKNAGNGWRKK